MLIDVTSEELKYHTDDGIRIYISDRLLVRRGGVRQLYQIYPGNVKKEHHIFFTVSEEGDVIEPLPSLYIYDARSKLGMYYMATVMDYEN